MMSERLPAALADDADAKLNEFKKSLSDADLDFPEHEKLAGSIRGVFSWSDYVARSCIREPSVLVDLVTSGDLFKPYEPDGYDKRLHSILSETRDEESLKNLLRLFRKREMIRVAWRDLSGWSDLTETIADLSFFADACIHVSLSFLHEWHCGINGTPVNSGGEPQQLVILGMGKLGSRELNFSSDIDLVFAYPEDGKTRGGVNTMTNEEFFLSLCRRLLQLLGVSTTEGNLFRVDMRLRPYGENGPLVLSFDAMENYYESQGREWERYAWLRARAVAGDRLSGGRLLKRMSPFVYRRYLDYTVFDSLREMKHKISMAVRKKGMTDNVKLGQGGIREVEFFCQMFQVLRGGVDPDLREQGTLKLLKLMAEKKYVSQGTVEELSKAYCFLRNTEHRLQEFKDLQTHSIPTDALGRLRLAKSMGFESFEAYKRELDQMRDIVHSHFMGLLESDENEHGVSFSIDLLDNVWQGLLNAEEAEKILDETGYAHPQKVLGHLQFLREAPETRALSPKGRKRIDALVPRLLNDVGKSSRPDMVLNRIMDLIKSIERRTNYIALLLENPTVLSHLIHLAEKSPWIITFLAKHPVLLDELLDHRALYAPPDRVELETEIQNRLDRIPPDDLEFQIETLCIFKQTSTLRVAAADVTDVLPVMVVSDHLTEIAETILKNVMNLAWNYMVKKHGVPVCATGPAPQDKGFLIVGYGKVGGIELGYHSDLDLVFLHSGTHEETRGGDQPIETPYFFTRLGQRMVHILTVHTRAGVLYEADMRLRPSGAAGPLVSRIESFSDYHMNESWEWEKQALVRARPLCGDTSLARRFQDIRKSVLACKRDEEELKREVRIMRRKLRKERLKPNPDLFDLKEDEGGIVDIEFIVQFLVLLKSYEYPELLTWTDNVRILDTLRQSRIMNQGTAGLLKEAYLTFRNAIHRLNLQEKPARVPSDQFHELRTGAIEVWKTFMG